ncbi:NAD(P)H-dependent flavin oxidoreductase [Sphingomonas fennica]|uniref:Propionate 3-nitronate monooxygenase n=1 Tax=Edaphosphingomonas fennica TaxID=114404 RepID=A0A2T4HZU0_9SPHN|nr:nitronate monooxygenase [Sphingomonas fennica]PTD22017.1 2-nitropropane dioxygenase [Sphingomonas fennica]
MVTRASFLKRLGSAHPILLAPMAGAGGVGLAAGAMAGGAVGTLPCAMLSPGALRSQYSELRARAAGPINLNFFCHRLGAEPDDSAWRALLEPFYAEFHVGPPTTPPPLRAPFDAAMADLVEELRPEIVSFHFGLPDPPLMDRARGAGALILASATSVAEARWLAAHGVDAVIAQGWEAGGHAGRFLGEDPAAQMGLMALVPQVVDAVDVPVIAAGGIADGRGIAAALLLGASAVQIGSAYLHCPESLIHEPHRDLLASEAAEHSLFTNLFSGGLARGIPNRLMKALGPIREEAPRFPYASTALARLRTADPEGFGPCWAGQAARIGRPLPARTLTEHLAADALALLGRTDTGWQL